MWQDHLPAATHLLQNFIAAIKAVLRLPAEVIY